MEGNACELFELMPQMGAQMERLDCQCALPEYCFTHYLEPGYKDEDILKKTDMRFAEISESLI